MLYPGRRYTAWSSLFALVPILVFLCLGCNRDDSPPLTTPAPHSPPIMSVVSQAYLKSSHTERADLFGTQVALSGDTLAVGAWHESSCAIGINGDQTNNGCEFAGAVYVFVKNAAGEWTQQAYIKSSNPDFHHEFGTVLALNGDTLAVGAPGETGCATGVNGNQQQTGCNGSGAVYVFTRTAGVWNQESYVKPSHTNAVVFAGRFGESVALSGEMLAVGGTFEASCATGINGDQTNTDCLNAGAAYVFTRSSSGWVQQAYVKSRVCLRPFKFGLGAAGLY